MNVVQSVELKAPRLVADAVGTFSVMTGVVVLLTTVELKSVPEVPIVRAATDVTVPPAAADAVLTDVIRPYESTVITGIAVVDP